MNPIRDQQKFKSYAQSTARAKRDHQRSCTK
jgi:hypothetical protein